MTTGEIIIVASSAAWCVCGYAIAQFNRVHLGVLSAAASLSVLFMIVGIMARDAELRAARPTIQLSAPADVPDARMDFSRRNAGAAR